MDSKPRPLVNVSYSYNPLEETLEYARKSNSLYIGIPKENAYQENRIPLTPQAVSVLVNNGNKVVVENNAGVASSFSNNEFSEAGATIVYDKRQVFEAEIILKTAPIHEEELEFLQRDQVIFSPVHIPLLNKEIINKCLEKNIIGIALGNIKDLAGYYPIVRSMSQIAGIHSIEIASKYLSNVHGGRGILLGGIAGVPPANVVIIGAGMVGEYATRTALGAGAQVKVFDNSIYRLMRLQRTVGQTVFTSVIEPSVLTKALQEADVAIGALKPIQGVVPMVVNENMVSKMKPGSVIIDVSIDNGGVFETSSITSHQDPVFTKHDIIHYCVPNIASSISRTASNAISNVIMPIILSCSESVGGSDSIIDNKPGLIGATYLYKGKTTSKILSQKFNLKYTDLSLILSSKL